MATEIRWSEDPKEAAQQRFDAYTSVQSLYEWYQGITPPAEESPVPEEMIDKLDWAVSLAFNALEAARRPLADPEDCPCCHGHRISHARESSDVPGCPVCGYGSRKEEIP